MNPISWSETISSRKMPATSALSQRAYYEIASCTESYFDRLGDSPLGMGWPNVADAVRRYQVMLDLIPPRDVVPQSGEQRFGVHDTQDQNRPIRLLDLGCGCGHLYEYLCRNDSHGRPRPIQYTGIDLSEKFIQQCRSKHPQADFRQADVLLNPDVLGQFDYAVINGVFTSRCSMSFEQMWEFVRALVRTAFEHTTGGIAFNAMSKQVDWERDDLFHLPLDLLAGFLCADLSRHFVIRNDYGLYEFTTYVYHQHRR